MIIDTHCHLNFKAFDKDLNEVIHRAQEAGVAKIIIPGAKIDSSRKAVEIAQKYSSCFAAVGIHPHHINEFIQLGKSITEEKLKEILHSTQKNKIVAVGEVGLDYHEYKGYPPITDEIKTDQKKLLLLQIEIALEYNLPVIFHCRDAHDDQMDLLKNLSRSSGKRLAGVFHCFAGEKKHLEKVLDMGFYVGFDGNITYNTNEKLRGLIINTPLDKLLLETDSPYLAPDILRGQRNEPTNLQYLAQFVAGIKRITLANLSTITSRNARRLFKI